MASRGGRVIKIKTTYKKQKAEDWLDRVRHLKYRLILEKYALEGVLALKSATPQDTGKTASSWSYRVLLNHFTRTYSIEWRNSYIENGIQIAVVLEMGHGTGTGGWVQGRDYINPTIAPIMDKIADMCWKEVNDA